MKKRIPILLSVLFLAGCAAPLSKNTCSSLQGVSMRIMIDRQTGLTKDEAIAKLALFTAGKPDAKPFSEVATRIIGAAYEEPQGATESEKSGIVESFVSRIDAKCLSGELNPSYNPVIRAAPALLQ